MEKYQRLSLDERDMIGQLLSQGKSLRFIAEALSRNVSTISREVGYFLDVILAISHDWLIIVQIIFLQDIIPEEE